MAAQIDREWIAGEFSKGIGAEHHMAHDAKGHAESPFDPELTTLYREIAEADERHARGVELVAVRYGHTPSKNEGGGIGETLSRLKDKVTGSVMKSDPQEELGHDLASKANAIHWYNAWIHTFEALGDTESAREMAAILTEENAHRDVLQAALNRLVERGARGGALEQEAAGAKSS